MATFEELFDAGTNECSHKWRHYFEIYERYFQKFKGTKCTYLEIGVSKGGSLEIMQKYLGPDARIVGVDVNPACAELRAKGREIYIGDQSDPKFLEQVVAHCGPFDIILDDGSHFADHQLMSFFSLFPALKEGGVYMVEDMHTVFWAGPANASRFGINFYDFARGLVEKLTLYHVDQRLFDRYAQPYNERTGNVVINNFALNEIFGIHFYDSVIAFEKRRRVEPIREIK